MGKLIPKLNYNNTIRTRQCVLMYQNLLDIGRIQEGGAAHKRMLYLKRVLELQYAVNSTFLSQEMKDDAIKQRNELSNNGVYKG